MKDKLNGIIHEWIEEELTCEEIGGMKFGKQ